MRPFGEKSKNKVMRAKAQSGQYHTNMDGDEFMHEVSQQMVSKLGSSLSVWVEVEQNDMVGSPRRWCFT